MRILSGALLILLASQLAIAQPATAPLRFDVASVKVSPPIGGQNTFVGTKLDPGRVRYANLQLIALIMTAFDVNWDQIAGLPGEFRYPLAFSIEATFPVDTSKAQVAQMLRTLLVERFGLVFHHETRPTPVYALVVAKNGPKLKVSKAQTTSYKNLRPGLFEAAKVTLPLIVNRFHNSGWIDRPMADNTNLTGEYDVALKWTPENATTDDLSAPSLFTAIQEQWGLRLEAQTVPLDFLVIDHVAKPTEN